MRNGFVCTVLLFAVACGGAGSRERGDAAPRADAPPRAAARPLPGDSTLHCPVRGDFDPASGYYSQFYEDYILAYVLHDRQTGSFVDVGANDPNVSSVTKYFYLKGWRGVDVEPNPEMVKRLRQYRPEDYVAPVGISDKPGTLTFYNFVTAPGLSTFDRKIADRHRKAGFTYQELRIPVDMLSDVLAKQDKVAQSFTFMNVDVEGFEREVLSSIDFQKYTPEIVLAEATAPTTEIPTYQSWESLLADHGYVFALDDGLNRYYVHADHKDLLPRFVEVNYCVEKDKLSKGLELNGYMPEKH